MADAVRRTLHRILSEEKLSTDRLVVLSPRSLDGSDVWRKRTFGNWKLVEHGASPGPGEVPFSSVQRFKGLEADAVLLCEVDSDSPTCSPRHLYVATSRARHLLIVLRYAP